MALVEIDRDICDNTQACEAVCPEDVFLIHEGYVKIENQGACIQCCKCMENCPAGAVTVDF